MSSLKEQTRCAQDTGATTKPSPLLPPLDDNDHLIDYLSDVTKTSAESVRAKLLLEERRTGSNVVEAAKRLGVTPNVFDEKMLALYETTDAFLYDSAAWNRKPRKLEMREWIADYLESVLEPGSRVLTYGDGLGFDAAYLALRGQQVCYFELSPTCCAFAKRMFGETKADVEMLDDPAELAGREFDAVVCLDVLEHLPDPVSQVAKFSQLLRPHGRLVISAPYFMLGEYNSLTHLKCNKRYSGDLKRLYEAHELYLVDGRTLWDPLVLAKCPTKQLPADSRPLRRFKLRTVGAIYSLGRIWSGPFGWLADWMIRSEQRQVEELETHA